MMRVTLSIPDDLIEQINEGMEAAGKKNRSEFICDQIRYAFAGSGANDIDYTELIKERDWLRAEAAKLTAIIQMMESNNIELQKALLPWDRDPVKKWWMFWVK